MQTHSSSVVAVKAARALASLTAQEFPTVEEYVRALERNSSALRRAKPSHATLYNTQRRIIHTVAEGEYDEVEAAKAATEQVIEDVIDTVESAKSEAAANAAEELADDRTILTHDYSTTVIATLERLAEVEDGVAQRPITLFITEARPRYLGRKTARHFGPIEGIDVHLIVDSASAQYLPECDRVLVGMDSLVEDVLYNRVGTHTLSAAAADAGVPVTAVGASTKIPEGGFQFQNERRPVSEVMREPAEGFVVENVNYDGTPVELLDSIATDDGIRRPGE